MSTLRIRWYLISLFLLCFVTYASSFNNQFLWDDEQFIYKNVFVKNFDVHSIFTTDTTAGAGEKSNYYRPLTTLSFAVDHSIWGLEPFGFHLTNTFLHTSAGLLLFLILLHLKIPRFTSFIITCFFLIHPLQTESVTYVNSRGDSQYTFFLFLGLFSFLQLLNGDPKNVIKKIVWGVAAWVCYFLSILSKEIGLAGFGLYLLVLIYNQWLLFITQTKKEQQNIGHFLRKYVWQSWGWFVLYLTLAITIVYLILRSTVLNFTGSLNLYEGTEYGSNLIIRLQTFFKVWLQYISLLFFPVGLHMDRQVEIVRSALDPQFIAGFLLMMTVTCFGIYLWYRYHKLQLLFGWAWFIGMLVPVSGIIPINGMMYEHWLYVPQIGFWLSISAMGNFLIEKYKIKWWHTTLFTWQKVRITVERIVLVLIIIVFCALSIRQNYYWHNPIRFFNYLLQYTQTARIYNNLAMAYSDNNQPEKSIEIYERSLAIFNGYPQTYHNLGNAYKQLGNVQQAEQQYLQAISLSPDFYWSRFNLAQLYVDRGEYEQAEIHLKYLSQQFPESVEIKNQVTELSNLMNQSK